MSLRFKIWICAALGLVLVQAVVSFLFPQNFVLIGWSDITQFLLLLSGTLALVPNILATRGKTRLFWLMMALGVSSWFCYQGFWTYIEVFQRGEVPNPFVGDVVLVLHIVPMMAALAFQPHVEQDERTFRFSSLDFTLLLVWWLYLYVVAVIPWQYVSLNESAYSFNLNAVYLAEKIAFLSALAIVWVRSKGPWRTIYLHWFGASLTYAFSSYLANWAIQRHVYYSGSLYDLPLALSMAWVTIVGIVALRLSPKQQPARNSNGHGVWVARLGMGTMASLPLFAAWSVFNTAAPPNVRTFRLVVTLCCMLIMGAMVFIKQHLLDRELLGLLRTSEQSFQNLRRLQAQLVQSEKLASLGQLVGGAAHELNNPLTAILGYSELLTETPLNTEQQALAKKIAQQVRRTKTLVSSLLSFAKQVPFEKSLLDLNSLTHTAVKLCQPQMRTANVQLRTDLAQVLPLVSGDSNQLLQVCLHIINNALNAMAPAGGFFSVNTKAQGNAVILEFSDTGPGIQEPDRVFDPFYTTKPVGQGTGLGLSACYGIIAEHSGKIFCENRPSGGATFRIELPAATTPNISVSTHSTAFAVK
ncbi:MAG TPA: ATP-binding protein [Terriglobales bacterium]|nr:ATP-binding protein [Terriglobales bacterium]